MNNADKPAFPFVHKGKDENGAFTLQAKGLTKRERFAMAAMQALMTGNESRKMLCEIAEKGDSQTQSCAKLAIEYADALLKELEETNEN